ncbi:MULTISPECIES: efflux RND transporter periplasmic adaptor subunit [unclassified Pseudodesulfovibrio]|uniref:efflux RND transporter periplasmic adaptor subunit n=1 Tax=unclassified Pseudodesulfovibrio TaxID=2661612 RepID=UPI000FEC111D|nr:MULTISPECIES: efflux RND transporter periplasmic adaptor subunit [unclassified Pseudodesulfovibrio]MCJ2165207.1 efflux RND transporter periplasmic adaptor subunit [Pseudodesulfovibrio sp. S3-i]RWU03264.1 efflux RND transporter periplasmic adaptor subunit [Pseudodesulfovibrio sp. S3]
MRKIIMNMLSIVVVVALQAGCGSDPAPTGQKGILAEPESTATAELTTLPRLYDAVGTVQAKTDVRVEAQVTGRVLEVLVRPGDKVAKGDQLVVLDDRASRTRLERSRQAQASATSMTGQAKDALASAKAAHDKAESTYRRMSQLFEQKVVTAEEVEKAESDYLQAKAGLNQAEQGVTAAQARAREAGKLVQEAEIDLGYTTVTAQDSGEVARRLAEPGDLAFPGKELLTLHTGGSLHLEAMVRESLIAQIRLGQALAVRVDALSGDEPLSGVVEEIEPLADPLTRSFLVKVRLPERPGLYPGMFGRLMVPLGEEQTVLVPEGAVVRVGQLETVMVKTEQGWQPMYVRTGQLVDHRVEILSGLSGGEVVGIGPAADGGR